MSTKLALGILLFVVIGAGGYWYLYANHAVPQSLTKTIVPLEATVRDNDPGSWSPASALPVAYNNEEGPTWYWLSNNKVFCMNLEVTSADIPTFQFSSHGEYAKDKNNVYRCNQVVEGAEPVSFVMVNIVYAKDAKHVFYMGNVLEGVDPATFSIVPGSTAPAGSRSAYGKDATYVYYTGQLVSHADQATFVILSPFIPVDKNWIYTNNVVFGPASLISETYAQALPPNCTKEGTWTPKPAPIPSIFSKDETVVGYAGPDAVCIIDKKTQKSEYYEKGWEDGVALSDDGSKLYYSIFMKGGGVGGGTCSDCGTYAIDRTTGKEERIK